MIYLDPVLKLILGSCEYNDSNNVELNKLFNNYVNLVSLRTVIEKSQISTTSNLIKLPVNYKGEL